MIVGMKKDWEEFKSNQSTENIKKLEKRLKWDGDIWWINQVGDGSYEKEALKHILKTREIPDVGTVFTPDGRQLSAAEFRKESLTAQRAEKLRSRLPTARKPGRAWDKVKSYWRAVSSPKVSQDDFNFRLSQCTKKGGYSIADASGVVSEIDGNRIAIGDHIQYIPNDEQFIVKVGDEVQLDQIIADGSKDKPCPYLVTKNTESGEQLHCGACGCGDRSAAELKKKLWHSDLTCPRVPPLFTQITVKGK